MQNGMRRHMNTHTNAKLLESCSDELERLALEEVHKRRRSTMQSVSVCALVLPVGRGELAHEMARLGCQVTGLDESGYESDFNGRALASGLQDRLKFIAAPSLDALPEEIPGEPFDIIFCRRSLCTMPYDKARQTVRKLLFKLKIGGKLYVSALGMHSELGDNYRDAETVIENRFCLLDPGMAKKYGINDPLCLYSERNLFMLLLEAGGSVLRTFTTTHGSVKGVAVRV